MKRKRRGSYLGIDIKDLNENKRGEGDGNDICVGVVEHEDREHYDYGALLDESDLKDVLPRKSISTPIHRRF
jgi:hypothetical protein